MPTPADKLRIGLVQQLMTLRDAGIQQIPATKPANLSNRIATMNDPIKASAEPGKTSESPVRFAGKSAGGPPANAVELLTVLREQVSHCTRCPQLAAARTNTVFGVGNPRARLCLFGEAPGADEDRLGEPFVGRAGQLLDRILAACTLTRKDVYILNVIKCRPPGNRNPTSDEVENCRGYFERQLELISPEFICCLGAVAATTLLDKKTSIGSLRGGFHDYRGVKVLATYHPAYLLRNPAAKKEVWKDMQLLMNAMGIVIPKRAAD